MDPQLDEPDLRSYLGVIRRRKWLVGFVTLVFLGVAIAMSVLPEPVYEASVKVKAQTGLELTRVAMGQTSGFADAERQSIDQLELLDSNEIRFAAIGALPEGLPKEDVWKVDVHPIMSDTDNSKMSSVAELTLASGDPEVAAQVLTVYSQTYVELRQNESLEEQLTLMSALSEEVSASDATVADLEARLNESTDTAAQENYQSQLRQALDDRNFYQGELNRLTFGVDLPQSSARVIGPASKPTTPITPNLPKNVAIGLSFGLFLGIAVAFLRDYFDDSVKSKDVVERVTGVPALGLIPRIDSKSELIAAKVPNSAAAEAFRSLRTSVKFLSVDREVRVVQVTSPSAGEGKTVTAINLATVFAQAGDRVVLVGADLRRPRAEEILDVPLTPGMTGVLIGEVALPQAIRAVDGIPNLSVLPSGYPPPNPSELLSGERARRLVDVLAQTYDIVIIDCPPVLPVTDALVVARMADTTLLVNSATKTSRRSLDRCVELLQQVDAPLMGTVLTHLGSGATFAGGGYGYDHKRYKRRKSKAGGNGYDGYPAEAFPAPDQGTLTGQHPTMH